MAGLNDHILLGIKIHIIGTNFLRKQMYEVLCFEEMKCGDKYQYTFTYMFIKSKSLQKFIPTLYKHFKIKMN